MRRGLKVISKRAWSIRRIFGQSADDQLDVSPAWVFDWSDEIGEPIRSLASGLAVGPVDCDSIDKHCPEIAVLRGPLCGDIGDPAFRQKSGQHGVRHMEIKLKSRLGAVFDRRLGIRITRERQCRAHSEHGLKSPAAYGC